MKYKYTHVCNKEKKEYHDYYSLLDVVNSMSADRFIKNVKHAVALTMFQSSYFRFCRDFDELRQMSDKKLREEYYRIKTKEDHHLIGVSIYGFSFKVEHKTHYVSVHLSVQVIDKQLKFVITYCCSLPNKEEIETSDLDELHRRVEDWTNECIREEKQRKDQLAVDLVSLGVLGLKPAKKKQHYSIEELEKVCAAN